MVHEVFEDAAQERHLGVFFSNKLEDGIRRRTTKQSMTGPTSGGSNNRVGTPTVRGKDHPRLSPRWSSLPPPIFCLPVADDYVYTHRVFYLLNRAITVYHPTGRRRFWSANASIPIILAADLRLSFLLGITIEIIGFYVGRKFTSCCWFSWWLRCLSFWFFRSLLRILPRDADGAWIELVFCSFRPRLRG